MSAMDHKPSTGWGYPYDERCVWCHYPWPCETARVRHEIAGAVRGMTAEDPTNMAWACDCHHIADLIDPLAAAAEKKKGTS